MCVYLSTGFQGGGNLKPLGLEDHLLRWSFGPCMLKKPTSTAPCFMPLPASSTETQTLLFDFSKKGVREPVHTVTPVMEIGRQVGT